jgi:hypothetical protein
MVARAFAFAVLAMSLPSIAFAAPEKARPISQKSVDPDEIICEKIEVTGSRLAVRRVCMTRSEWAERRREDRENTEGIQTKLRKTGKTP